MKAGRLGMKNKEDLSEELANLAKNHAEIRPPCTKKSMVYENVCRRANNDVSCYPSYQKIFQLAENFQNIYCILSCRICYETIQIRLS